MARWLDGQLVPLLDGLAYGLLLFCVAAGLTLAYGVANVLNLAHGTLYLVGAYTVAVLGDGTWTGLALALATGTAAGALSGGALAVLVGPVIRHGPLHQALLTAGIALVGGALLVAGFGADQPPVSPPAAVEQSTVILGHHYPAYRLLFIVFAAALAAGGYLVVARTRVGALIRASADDRDMLALLETDPRLVQLGVLAAAGALAAAVGVLGAPILGPGQHTASTVLMQSLVIVVLGRLGSIPGALLAAVVVGEVQTVGVTLAPNLAPFLLFAAMATALGLRRAQTAGTPA